MNSLIVQKAGSGLLITDSKDKWKNKEVIDFGIIIGKDNIVGKFIETKWGTVHYSKYPHYTKWKRGTMMKLWTYIGKNVLVTLMDGQEFIGKVTNYDDEVDNESGEDSIHLDDGKLLYDFDESEIKTIEILN